MSVLLEVGGLHIAFPRPGGNREVVAGIGYRLAAGRTLGVVGESGCGKSVTALALMGLVPPPGVVGGSVRFEGRELVGQSAAEWRKLRGARVAMVFQEPMTALNPVMTVGRQIAEVQVLHKGIGWNEAGEKAVSMLEAVGINSPRERAASYPHQLSGGMRQRAMIAMALACEPALLIADEPTTALDVTIQAQILELLRLLQEELGTAILLITHDLAVIAETAHRVAVMYAGRIVETGPVGSLFAAPLHPYTEGLLRSIPRIARAREAELAEIPGVVPAPGHLPAGCAFAARCLYADAACHVRRPALEPAGDGREVACWKPRHG